MQTFCFGEISPDPGETENSSYTQTENSQIQTFCFGEISPDETEHSQIETFRLRELSDSSTQTYNSQIQTFCFGEISPGFRETKFTNRHVSSLGPTAPPRHTIHKYKLFVLGKFPQTQERQRIQATRRQKIHKYKHFVLGKFPQAPETDNSQIETFRFRQFSAISTQTENLQIQTFLFWGNFPRFQRPIIHK